MANPHRGTIDIGEIGGRERTLRFDHNALAEVEDRLKVAGIDETFALLSKGSSRAIRCVLWAGLRHEETTLTEKEVGSWDFSIQEVVPLLTRAIARAYGIASPSENGVSEGNAGRPEVSPGAGIAR